MITVTGASGYVGSHIVRRLVEDGKQVRAMVRDFKRARKESRLEGMPVEWVEADVTRSETLSPALQGSSAVIHTVAIAIEKGERNYETINFQGTVNLIQEVKAASVKRFINISQLGADASLPFRFLASKGKAQDYLAASGLEWTAFYPSAIWGPEDEFANSFARLVRLTPLIFPIVGDEKSRFQLVWVGDVASAVVQSLDDPSTIGKKFELGGPDVLSLEEIERRTLEAVGARRLMVHFPMPLLRIIVALMEITLPSPPVTRSLLELLQVSNVTSNNALSRFVPQPRPFTVENFAGYMHQFSASQTLAQFFGR